jgi:hypothetical protein
MFQFRPNLADQKNWVVVSGDQVFYYETFQEAVKGEKGNLMTKTYYDHHYKELSQ